MWSSTVNFSQIREKASWKVEFFSGGDYSKAPSPFRKFKISEILDERKETIDTQSLKSEEIVYIGLENIEPVTGRLIGNLARQGEDILSRSKRFCEGDVLYGRLRAYLNKCCVGKAYSVPAVCSTEFFVLKPRRELVLPHFLRSLLTSEYVLKHVEILSTGSALPRLQLRDFLKIEVPLPPLSFQLELENFLKAEEQKYLALVKSVEEYPRMIQEHLASTLTNGSITNAKG